MVSIANDYEQEIERAVETTPHILSDDEECFESALMRKHKAIAFLFIPSERDIRRAKRRSRRLRNQRFQRFDLSLGQVVQSSMLFQQAMIAQSLGGCPASMACLPVIIPFTMPGHTSDQWRLSVKAMELKRQVIADAWISMAFNAAGLVAGDLIGGILGIAVSGLGVYACQPGKYPFLPTYVVCSMVNGTVQTFTFLDLLIRYKGAIFGTQLTVTANIFHLVVLVNPITTFIGGVLAYKFMSELRFLATAPPDLVLESPEISPNAAAGPAGGMLGADGPSFNAFSGVGRSLGQRSVNSSTFSSQESGQGRALGSDEGPRQRVVYPLDGEQDEQRVEPGDLAGGAPAPSPRGMSDKSGQ